MESLICLVELLLAINFQCNCLYWLYFTYFQVRTFYRSCKGHASCNCAVAVKVYDDVFLVDKCSSDRTNDDSYQPIIFKMYRYGQMSTGFKVYRENFGKKYQVRTNIYCSFFLWNFAKYSLSSLHKDQSIYTTM